MNNIIVSGIVAGAISILIGIAFITTAPAAPTQPTNQDQTFGSLTGPDISSPYLNWGNVSLFNVGIQAAATSSTFCSIQNPAHATSTILGVGLSVAATGLGAQTFDVGTSTTNLGTSSPAILKAATVPSAGAEPISWLPGANVSTTSIAVLGNGMVPPQADGHSLFILGSNDYINYKIASGTPGVFASYLTAKCTVRLQKL